MYISLILLQPREWLLTLSVLSQETLTGFKWLGNVALNYMQKGFTFLFAFEEAIGMNLLSLHVLLFFYLSLLLTQLPFSRISCWRHEFR